MLGRRAVLLAGAACVARPALALPVPKGDTLTFRMVRHGSEIGRHTLTFEPKGDTLTVHVAVEATVTFLSIPVVRYTHRATETWQGGALVGLRSETDKNGQREWAQASRTGEGMVVQGSRTARYVAPEPAIGTSYWNKRMLDGPMISLEDGVLLRPKVAVRGAEALRTAYGNTIPAEHYNLSGAFDVDVWYDRSDTWAGLAVTAPDGSNVQYERL